jgi:hypothetical protein
MRSTDFRSVVEPILNEVFDGIYNQRDNEHEQVFQTFTGTPRAYHEEPVLFGFGAAPELPDGVPVVYQSGGVLFIKRYLYKVYGLAFALTKVLAEDGDHIQMGTTYAEHLAQSLVETKETLCANVLNFAFNGAIPIAVGGDGVSLNNSAHPIANGTFSNLLTTAAALSQTSLEQMLIQVRNAVDNNGKRIRLTPTQIVGGSSQVFQGEVLVKSVLRTGTNNNDINPVKSTGMLKKGVAILSRVTSTTAWWVQTDAKRGLRLAMRRKLEKSMEGDFDTDSMRYKATERYIPGFTDPRTVWGTPGL